MFKRAPVKCYRLQVIVLASIPPYLCFLNGCKLESYRWKALSRAKIAKLGALRRLKIGGIRLDIFKDDTLPSKFLCVTGIGTISHTKTTHTLIHQIKANLSYQIKHIILYYIK
jgi:hypothetical protein